MKPALAMNEQATARPTTSDAEDDARRYEPPATWQRVSVSALLTGSPREMLSDRQAELLASVVRDEQARVYVAGDQSLLGGDRATGCMTTMAVEGKWRTDTHNYGAAQAQARA